MLEVNNLSFKVTQGNTEKQIVNDVSFFVPDKSFVVITGPNGSGKSTIAKLVAGIEKSNTGSIVFEGKDITDLSITERARAGIGFAFQRPVRFKGLTTKDLIELAAGQKLTTEDVCHYLAEVGLCAKDYVNRELDSSLSGGELKRIEIAMLMARGTKLSIFDEPEAGIDLWSFHSLIKVFEKMRDKNDSSIIIISHQERILEIADHIIVLAEGRISKFGPREEILPGILNSLACSCKYYKGVS